MVSSFLSKLLWQFSLFFLFLFSLFCLLERETYDHFEQYFYQLDELSPSERYGNLLAYNWLTDDRIKFGNARDFQPKKLVFASNKEAILKQIKEKKFSGYLGDFSTLKDWVETEDSFRIIGKNRHQKGYAFLILSDSDLSLQTKNSNSFYRFITWLKMAFQGNFGATTNGKNQIRTLFFYAFRNSLILIFLTVFFIIIAGVGCSVLITYSKKWLKHLSEGLLEFFSAVPEFIFSFLLLYLFAYSSIQIYADYGTFFYTFWEHFDFYHLKQILFYFSLPVLALSLSGGTVSVLSKYINESFIQSQKSDPAVFFRANGMKKKYLHYLIPLKRIVVVILSFIGTKLPLIIGSSVVIEKIFSIQGVGNLAFEYFEKQDVGMILFIFSFLYLISIVSCSVTNFVVLKLNPVAKENL